jgi:tetratricopeptide (TPR) repeat protein
MSYEQRPSIIDLIFEYESALESDHLTFFAEETYCQLIDYYLDDQQVDRAMEAVERALTHHPFSADFYLRKADLLIHQHDHQAALDTLHIAENFAPGNFDIQLMKAEALSDNGHHQEALDLLAGLGSCVSDEELTDLYVTQAHVYDNLESYEQMFFVLKAALEMDPAHEGALEGMWICVEATKRYKESIEVHKHVIDEVPYSYLAWYNLGHAYSYQGQYEEAMEAFEFAFLANEEFEFAYREFADLGYELKYHKRALDVYQEILQRFTPDSDLLLRCGQCFLQLDLYDPAITYFRESLKFDPMNDEAFFHLGESYTFKENWTTALTCYIRAIEIEELREEYFASMGEVYFRLGEEDRAEECFEKAVGLAPQDSQYWVQYASFLMTTGRETEALTLLDRAEEEAPDVELQYGRIACLFALGRRQEAIYRLGEALAEDFDKHPLLFDLIPEIELDPDVLTLILTYRL